jgi:hypothetical protein
MQCRAMLYNNTSCTLYIYLFFYSSAITFVERASCEGAMFIVLSSIAIGETGVEEESTVR